ncbi:MAG: helix-turn-helix domain-containing protein [Gaiellaceae bacterium]
MSRRPPRHVDTAPAVGRRLRQTREQRGLTQRDLAFEGCTPAYISRIEAGDRVPSLQILREFSARLGVSVDYLATGAAMEVNFDTDALSEAILSLSLGEAGRAEELFDAAIAAEPDPRTRARALAGLGELAFLGGRHEEAVGLLRESLETGELLLDEAATAADRLGRVYSLLGETESAIGLYEQWLERAHQAEDPLATARFSTLLANVVLDAGNPARAEELLGGAIALAEKMRDPVDVARLWWSQSRLHTFREQPELADRYARRAISLLESTEHTGFAAAAYQLLAHAANDRGDGEAALKYIEEGYPVVAVSGNRYHEALFRLEQARAHMTLGDAETAGTVAMGAIPALADASPVDAGRGYALLAQVFRSMDDAPRAIELYELAAENLPPADRYLIEVYTGLGELLEEQGRVEEALAVFKHGLRLRGAERRS